MEQGGREALQGLGEGAAGVRPIPVTHAVRTPWNAGETVSGGQTTTLQNTLRGSDYLNYIYNTRAATYARKSLYKPVCQTLALRPPTGTDSGKTLRGFRIRFVREIREGCQSFWQGEEAKVADHAIKKEKAAREKEKAAKVLATGQSTP